MHMFHLIKHFHKRFFHILGINKYRANCDNFLFKKMYGESIFKILIYEVV